MWKEYTRESPARSGLGILVSAGLLLATLWLAARVTTAKAVPVELSERVEPAGWPISFRLPGGAQPMQGVESLADYYNDGSVGDEAFQVPLGPTGVGRVLVRFEVLRPGLTPETAARGLLLGTPADTQEISMGPLTGMIAEDRTALGHSAWMAVGCVPDGLAVGIRVLSTESSRSTEALLRAICDSVRFESWTVRRSGR